MAFAKGKYDDNDSVGFRSIQFTESQVTATFLCALYFILFFGTDFFVWFKNSNWYFLFVLKKAKSNLVARRAPRVKMKQS